MPQTYALVVEMKDMLANLDRWIEGAAEHAKSKNFDPNVFVTARLAPDQYPLVRQVQSACDTAKFTAARLTGKTPPSHPDTETTIEELRLRIANVRKYLDTYTEKDFDGAETRIVAYPSSKGTKGAPGADYLVQFGLPNFFFHVTTAYSILRHNGVALGKTAFIGTHVKLVDL